MKSLCPYTEANRGQNRNMNRNLSMEQFSPQRSITKAGAMPRDSKFDEKQVQKISGEQNKYAPGANKPLAKPGFF
jgi:hypothetical protein